VKRPKTTIVIPIYNEARTINASLSRLITYLKKSGLNYDIVLFDDASTDNLSSALPKPLPENVSLIRNTVRMGRGETLKKAIRSSKTDIIVYLDADLSFELDILPLLIKEIEKGTDIAIGSRLLSGSKAKRSRTRMLASKTYNGLARSVLGSKVHDHQCGCKAFNRKNIIPLLPPLKSKHWFWDTELLVVAQKKSLKISEIPVIWWEGSYSSVNVLRDAVVMFGSIISLRLRLGKIT